jgi:phospholipase C
MEHLRLVDPNVGQPVQPSRTGARPPGGGITRRALLAGGAATAAAVGLGRLPDSVIDAIAAPPLPGRLQDIEHVVFLIQENRSFDHYFGTYRGVRGFADPRARRLADGSGMSVIAQPGYDVPGYGGHLFPFHLDAAGGSGGCVSDPDHSWGVQHRSWNDGRMDAFLREHLKADGATDGPVTMGYYGRRDLGFYHALADAFTICDAYHCSVLGPSYGNQAYIISATLDPAGKNGGPLISDAPYASLSWRTMPEALQAHGISWKVYTSPDNYAPEAIGDPIFHLFKQYTQDAALGQRAFTNTFPGTFEQDCRQGTLPQVSWVYAPILFSEHPPAPVNSGEASTAMVLEALTSNAELWKKTALIVTYDENGGFFDHVPPPTPARGTPGEELTVKPLPDEAGGIAGPIGLGFRVPALICSPFSRGGLVCSATFDHTSLLRFLEVRFGVEVPNLTDWRRETVGDLTDAFNFAATPDPSVPALPATDPSGGAIMNPNCALSAAGSGVTVAGGSKYSIPPNSMPLQEPGAPRRPSGLHTPATKRPKRRRKRRRRKRAERKRHRRRKPR